MSVADDIAKIREEAKRNENEATRLATLAELYPDLRRHEGRWKKIVYCSKSANVVATRFDMRHSCGCCNDSPLEIWPYVETEHGNVYSDPPRFQVGERHWISGDKPYDGWQKAMRDVEIPEAIVVAVEAHFARCREERLTIASEE